MGKIFAKQFDLPCGGTHILDDGSEVLFDATRIETPQSAWFEAEYWAAQGCLNGQATGRGQVSFVRFAAAQWALRHYRRGGLVGRLIHDVYLYTGSARVRSFAEFRLLHRLRAAGLPVPIPVAARYRRYRGFWYRADLITERIVGTRTLAELLVQGRLPEAAWMGVGMTIRRFHDAGVDHTDLNAHNILGDSSDNWFLIDFDRCSLQPARAWRARNLARLRRSLEKVLPSQRQPQLARDWCALHAGYEEGRST